MTMTARERSGVRGRLAHALQLLLLGALVACAKTAEQWQGELGSTDPFVRGMAAIGMSLQSPREAGPALPELLRTIDRSDVGLEQEAAWALIQVGPFHVQALLDSLVEDELMSKDRRGAIKNALVSAGQRAPIPIVACMRGPGSHLVGDLGDVLLVIGLPSVPAILEMLEEEQDIRLQKFAAFLLGRMGSKARSALPALEAAMSGTDPELVQVAREAISSIMGRRLPAPLTGGDSR